MIAIAWAVLDQGAQTRQMEASELGCSLPSIVGVHAHVGFVSSEGLWIIYCGY